MIEPPCPHEGASAAPTPAALLDALITRYQRRAKPARKKITATDADELIARAAQIRSLLGC